MKMSNNMADRKPVAGIINLWGAMEGVCVCGGGGGAD